MKEENIRISLNSIDEYKIDVKKDSYGNISLKLEENVDKYERLANIVILKFNYSGLERNKKDAIYFFERVIKSIKELK